MQAFFSYFLPTVIMVVNWEMLFYAVCLPTSSLKVKILSAFGDMGISSLLA